MLRKFHAGGFRDKDWERKESTKNIFLREIAPRGLEIMVPARFQSAWMTAAPSGTADSGLLGFTSWICRTSSIRSLTAIRNTNSTLSERFRSIRVIRLSRTLLILGFRTLSSPCMKPSKQTAARFTILLTLLT